MTSANKSQQKPTFKPLSIEQENAIDLLIVGKGDQDTASAVGVNRTTIWEWRQNPVFVAELNRRRHALWADAQEQLRALVAKAIDVLEEAIDGHEVRAAIEVLKAVKLYGEVGAPQGPVEPDAVIRELAEAQVRREGLSEQSDLSRVLKRLENGAYHTRVAEVEAEIRNAYVDA
jgi:Helix-turn-helix of insertion element transposase